MKSFQNIPEAKISTRAEAKTLFINVYPCHHTPSIPPLQHETFLTGSLSVDENFIE